MNKIYYNMCQLYQLWSEEYMINSLTCSVQDILSSTIELGKETQYKYFRVPVGGHISCLRNKSRHHCVSVTMSKDFLRASIC